MITLITGAPGAGKTAALVRLLLALSKDRALYVDGIPDLGVAHIALEEPRRWPELVPDGSAVVIDEVQRVWRPAGPGARVPPDIEALETHRHRGLDFFIVTQHPKLLHTNVRQLVGRHVHLRDIGILGRWWYEWPECCADPNLGWKTAPHRERYRLNKPALALYRSASMHIKPVRRIPPVVLGLSAAVLVLGGLGWYVYGRVSSKFDDPSAAAPAPADAAASASAVARMVMPADAGPVGSWPVYVETARRAARDPYENLAFVLDGSLDLGGGSVVRYFGVVQSGQRVATVSMRQLARLGFSFDDLGPCSGLLRRAGFERAVSCALPVVPLRPEAPASDEGRLPPAGGLSSVLGAVGGKPSS